MTVRVLILCTANSARSQMAEGLLRELAGETVEVYSAGSKPAHVNPYAVKAMSKCGIDISAQKSKSLQQYLDQPFDYVITVCDNAAETCPTFPGRAERIHWRFPDPAAVNGTDAQVLESFMRVRDGLETKLEAFAAEL